MKLPGGLSIIDGATLEAIGWAAVAVMFAGVVVIGIVISAIGLRIMFEIVSGPFDIGNPWHDDDAGDDLEIPVHDRVTATETIAPNSGNIAECAGGAAHG